ncbi:MAG: A24 family peptidase C-terminal domain-containing protein [Candidatus Hydrothermarchaeales archaeon]
MTMLDILFVALAVSGALIASVTDLKSRIIPNKLSLGLLTVGVVGNTTYALYVGDTSLLVDLARAIILIFVIGYLFWVLGGWSAGDAKEFIFLASLLPRYPKFLYDHLTPNLASYPFPLTILINTFVLILPALIIYFIIVSYKNLNLMEFLNPLLNLGKYLKEAILIVSALLVGVILGKPYLGLIALLAFHVPWSKNIYKYLVSLLIIIVFLASNDTLAKMANLVRYLVATTVFFAILGVFWNSIGILRSKALQEICRISDLHEGDVIAEEIYIQDGEVKRDNRDLLEKFKRLVISEKERKARKTRNLIASPKAAGLSAEDLTALKNYVAEGQLEDKIMVKKSMPFAPVVLLGLLSALLWGDIGVTLNLAIKNIVVLLQ